MRRGLLALILVTVVVIAAAAAALFQGSAVSAPTRAHASPWPPLDTAPAFFLSELRDKTDGDWDAAWRTLYPAHKRVVSRAEFVGCERATPFESPLTGLRVIGVHRSPVHVPGRARPVPGVGIDVRVELAGFGVRDPIVFRHTFHLVPVRGHWTWLLSPSRYRLYRTHGCDVPGLSG
jgi:hypothetical protein